MQVAEYSLDKVQPRSVSFEEAVTTMREHLSNIYEQEEEWAKAAQTLAGAHSPHLPVMAKALYQRICT